MAWPTDLVRTKDWTTEVLTDSDLEGQFDLIIAWLMALASETSGHAHTGAENHGPKLSALASLTFGASQAQGDIIYASSASVIARLGAGTSGKFLQTQGASANPQWASVDGGPLGSFKNLKITRGSVTQVTVTADELVLEDSSNSKVTVRTVSQTAAITTSGAGGLDTGSEASSTWYYIWIIRKSSDGTTNILLSTSSTAPTMPSGYDQKALVGAVRNNGSSDFVNFTQRGRQVWYTAWQSMASNSGNTTWNSVDITAYVPSGISEQCFGTIQCSTNQYSAVTNDSSVATANTAAPNKVMVSSGGAAVEQAWWELDVITANTLYYFVAGTGAMYIAGYVFTKGS